MPFEGAAGGIPLLSTGSVPAPVLTQYLRSSSIEVIAAKDMAEWMDIFARADVPVVPVHEGAAVAEDPQMLARLEWIAADQGAVTLKSPVHSDPAIADPSPAPAIGQDSAEVLSAIGLDAEEIARLASDGIVHIATPETQN